MKLALGSVQFGMPYGIANLAGQPPESEVRAILRLAASAGIDLIDTAAGYGNSEAVLGRAMEQIDASWRIVSKVPALRNSSFTAEDAGFLRRSIENSLGRLRQPRLYGILAHNAEDLLAPGGERFFSELISLKAEHLVSRVGVSVYDSETAIRIVTRFAIDLVQIPVNLFDQRAVQKGHLKSLKAASVEIHARSAFLQGLFFLPPDSLPRHVAAARAHVERLQQEAAARNVSVHSIALGYLNSIEEIDAIVVGVDSAAQLRENLRASAELVVRPEDYGVFACADEQIINPSMWPPRL